MEKSHDHNELSSENEHWISGRPYTRLCSVDDSSFTHNDAHQLCMAELRCLPDGVKSGSKTLKDLQAKEGEDAAWETYHEKTTFIILLIRQLALWF